MPNILYLDDTGVSILKTLIGEPTDEQVTAAVNAVLAAHPEWTTTVQDGSITKAKLADGAVTDPKLGRIDSIISRYADIAPYLYKLNSYVNPSGEDTYIAGYDTYKIPVSENDLVVMAWNAKFWGSLSSIHAVKLEKTDGTFESITVPLNASWAKITQGTNEGRAVMLIPDGYRYLVLAYQHDFSGNFSFGINYPLQELNDQTAVRRLQTYVPVDERCAFLTNIYFRSDGNTASLTGDYKLYMMPVKAGDRVLFSSRPLTNYATLHAFSDLSTTDISTADWTVPEDGIMSAFLPLDLTPNAIIISADSIKIDASNIINTPEPSFSGIEWVSFGDSITAQNRWQPYIVNALGMNHTNCGIGSTPLSGSNANAFWQNVRLDAVKAANPDLVTILGGANDLVLNPVIGTDANLSDKDTSTFIGAYSYIINDLLTWKPSLRIVILSTTWAHDDGATYSQTVTYGQFAEACKKVAEYYKLPFVNLYDNSGFNSYTMGTAPNNIYSSDSIHPNEAGAKIIASQVLAKLCEVMLIH